MRFCHVSSFAPAVHSSISAFSPTVEGFAVMTGAGRSLIRSTVLQYIDMEDPKAALAKTLNQTALTQDGALAAIEGMSSALTQGVGTGPPNVHPRSLCDVSCVQPAISRLCMLLTPQSRCCAPHCAQGLWRKGTLWVWLRPFPLGRGGLFEPVHSG